MSIHIGDIEEALEGLRVEYGAQRRVRRAILNGYRRARRDKKTRAIVMIGDTGTGKTSTLARVLAGVMKTISDPRKVRAIYVRLDSRTNDRGLVAKILKQIGHPAPKKAAKDVLESDLRRMLNDMGVKMVLLDECHHLVTKTGKERNFLVSEQIKTLIDTTNCLYVLAGVRRLEHLVTQEENDQFRRRTTVVELPAFSEDLSNNDFLEVAEAYDQALPFRILCGFADYQVALALWRACEGLLGHLVALIVEAGDFAIERGADRIEPVDLYAAYESRWRRIKPDDVNPFECLPLPPRRDKRSHLPGWRLQTALKVA